MSPMFHKHDDDPGATVPAADPALDAEVARLGALTLPQLAAEILTKAFTPQYDPTDAVNDIDGIASSFWDRPRRRPSTIPLRPHPSWFSVISSPRGCRCSSRPACSARSPTTRGTSSTPATSPPDSGGTRLQRNTVAQALGPSPS